MSPKPRNKENKGLPKRWVFKGGGFYYIPKESERVYFDNKKWFRLGSTEYSAFREYAKRIRYRDNVYTIKQLCDRFQTNELPKLAEYTQKSYLNSLSKIRVYFGDDPVSLLDARLCLQFVDAVESKHTVHLARKAFEVLRVLLKNAVQWGVIEKNPMRELSKPTVETRDRYITDQELSIAFKIADRRLQLYMLLKLITGLRQGEILSIKLSDLRDEGIYIKRSKGQKPVIYEWSDELRGIVSELKKEKTIGSLYLISTKEGKQYKSSGFASNWQRYMRKVVAAGVERFHEHDLRAKVASDTTLERARELLGHSDSKITERVYRRKVSIIKPLR